MKTTTANDNDDDMVSNQSSGYDYDYESYDTLGLHVDEEPNKGGITPDSAKSIGGVSAITTPEMMPVNHIKIPLPIVDEVPIVDVGGDTISTNTNTSDSNGTILSTASQEVRKKQAEKILQKGMKALDKSNFEIAAEHFKTGYLLLVGTNSWDGDYTTILQLCTEGANAAYKIGDLDTVNELIDVVLTQDISVEEKFKVYECKILALQAAGDNHASLSLGIDVRQQLGFYTPPNKAASKPSILFGYTKTRLLLGKRTAKELANLPKLTNRRVIMARRMLELVGFDCWTAQPTLFPLIVYLNIKETLEYGINPADTVSCNAFLGYGILLCGVFGDPQRGRDMALASELILAKSPLPKIDSRCTFISQGCIFHWTSPLKDTIAPLLKGYKMGIKYGDISSTGVNQSLLVSHTYLAGCSLEETDKYTSLNFGLLTAESSDAIQTQLTKYDTHVWHLVVSKLRGIELEENETDFDGILKIAQETNNTGLRSVLFAAQLDLNIMLFSEWETAADLLQEAGDLRSALVGIFTGVRFTFCEALISIKTAQSSSVGMITRWMWKRRGIRVIKIIRGWVELGNPNVVHMLHLLEAELAVLNRHDRLAEDSYEMAITTASANGFRQDKALSHELASMYYGSRGDVCKRDHHMKHAILCYEEWGAWAKADQLKNARISLSSSNFCARFSLS